ncbi:MAG: type II secretion system GspH family protein [Synergistaceae bacterium]|jgi:prepilin-type N-terminal cleavage/methylation domain-containing protein|nr:type II secretion system GspH family protein [Synergistaceae bacterium]
MPRSCRRRSFTLIEVLVTVAVLSAILSGCLVSGISLIKRFSDGRSDLVVNGEVEDAAAWLESIIRRALLRRADFTLMVSSGSAEPWLKVLWKQSGEREEWNAKNIAFKSGRIDSISYSYSNRFQTLTPALTMSVCYGDGSGERTRWLISISAYGFVKTYHQS